MSENKNQIVKTNSEQYCEDNLIQRGSFDEMIAEKAFVAGENSAIDDAIRAAHAVPDYFAGEKEQKWFIEILTKMIK